MEGGVEGGRVERRRGEGGRGAWTKTARREGACRARAGHVERGGVEGGRMEGEVERGGVEGGRMEGEGWSEESGGAKGGWSAGRGEDGGGIKGGWRKDTAQATDSITTTQLKERSYTIEGALVVEHIGAARARPWWWGGQPWRSRQRPS